MPERLSSLAFWAIFAGIIFAVAYPTLEAMRDDQPGVAASPAPLAVSPRGALGLPDVRRAPIAMRSPNAPSLASTPDAALRPRSLASALPTRRPARRPPATVAFRANRVAVERRWFNDTDFAYSGRWEHVRNLDDGRTNGSSSRSFHPGSQATLTFDGQSVRLYGVLGPGGGLGVVSIDGRQRQFVKFYAPVKSAHRLIYSSSLLLPGPHHVTISVVTDPTLEAMRARYVNIGGAYIERASAVR